MKINVGCGHKHIDGFLNIDSNPAVEPDAVCDCSNIDSLVPDQTASEIVAYDIIEHFDKHQAIEVLKHWRRKLETGGLLLIRTNDIDRLVRLYASHRFLGIHTGVDTALFIWHFLCEHDKPGMGHKWGYTLDMILAALNEAGFQKIQITPESMMVSGRYPYADCMDNTNLHVVAIK